ncbi:hypothetical protein K0U00_38350, partial [Paenibacillus sepulcri]|nr:hypothetical protein [Paenibacillus sepulcri]
MRKRRSVMTIFAACISLMIILTTGCGTSGTTNNENPGNSKPAGTNAADEGGGSSAEAPAAKKVTLTL